MNTDLMFSALGDEWGTPDTVYLPLHEAQRFVLDVAATEQNAKTAHFLGADALLEDWTDVVRQVLDELEVPDGAIWLNPPYSRCEAFLRKCQEEQLHGCPVPIVCLVPSRTDTRWWHRYVWDRALKQPRSGVTVDFIQSRVKFRFTVTAAHITAVQSLADRPEKDVAKRTGLPALVVRGIREGKTGNLTVGAPFPSVIVTFHPLPRIERIE